MNIEKVTAVYFSPTGGAKKYAIEIAKRIKSDFKEVDLTKAENRERVYFFKEQDLVVFGSPVYFGRIPQIKGGIFERIKGSGSKAIFTVTYGNRDYEDALLELVNLCSRNGFIGAAAAALIAPHAYSAKIAFGRPNNRDLIALDIFVKRATEIINDKNIENRNLTVKGKYPYRRYLAAPFSPNAKNKCKNCTSCVEVCPMEAISVNNPETTEFRKCIACLACVKACPYKVRTVKNPLFFVAKYMIERKLADKGEKIPEFFYVN